MESVLGTDVIEGNFVYLEKDKNSDKVRIVTIEGLDNTVDINELKDFVKGCAMGKHVRQEVNLLIAEANVRWLKKINMDNKEYNERIERLIPIALNIAMREKTHDNISSGISEMTPIDAYIIGIIIAGLVKPLGPIDAMNMAYKMSAKDAYVLGACIGTFARIIK